MDKYFTKVNIPRQDGGYTLDALQNPRLPTSLLERIERDERNRMKQAASAHQIPPPLPSSQQQDRARIFHERQERPWVEGDSQPAKRQRKPLARNSEDGSVDSTGDEWKNKRLYFERVMYVESTGSSNVPEKTNELCKWDGQPILGTPFPIPVEFNPREQKVYVIGYTCSVACALAYCKDTNRNGFFSRTRSMHKNILLLAKDYYGASFGPELVRCAPPREKLSMLYAMHVKNETENPMLAATREFRQDSESCIYKTYPTPPFVRVSARVDEEIVKKDEAEKHMKRLEQMNQAPLPIVCTTRGMQQQRKYVLAKRKGGRQNGQGTIDALLGIRYVQDDEDDGEEDE